MKALSALRKAFSLKKNEELGKKFDPVTLKRIVDAMKDYAAATSREQRKICQEAFDAVFESDPCDTNFQNMYNLGELNDCETPELE